MKLFFHSGSDDGAGRIAVIAPAARMNDGSPKACAAFDLMEADPALRGARRLDCLLEAALAPADVTAVAVVLNEDAVLDDELPARLDAALTRSADLDGKWAVLAACGLVRAGLPCSAIYAKTNPRINYIRDRQPVIDCGADFWVVEAGFLRRHVEAALRLSIPPASLPHWLVLTGYAEGRVSIYEPLLALGVDGSELGRDPAAHAALIDACFGGLLLDETLPSLSGPIAIAPVGADRAARETAAGRMLLADWARQAARPFCAPFALSIVTRTQFKRPHLIRRYLATLTRARPADADLEVVISTDIDRAAAERCFQDLQLEFSALTLRLVVNDSSQGHSRVCNLLGGIFAAEKDYIAFVDDDDFIHIDAFDTLSTLRFLGNAPLALMTTQSREETWTQTPSGRWVLESTLAATSYAPDSWRGMFIGYNHLPICAMILPRTWAQDRVRGFEMRHDLSEDYTLFLLLLSAPDLPFVQEVPDTFCVVSVRNDGSNTVTMQDRSPWVRDIALYLHDLFIVTPQAGTGSYQAQSAISRAFSRPAPQPAGAAPPARRGAGRELAALKAENAYLRQQIAALRDEERQS